VFHTQTPVQRILYGKLLDQRIEHILFERETAEETKRGRHVMYYIEHEKCETVTKSRKRGETIREAAEAERVTGNKSTMTTADKDSERHGTALVSVSERRVIHEPVVKTSDPISLDPHSLSLTHRTECAGRNDRRGEMNHSHSPEPESSCHT
jgi:hypothetical protein